MRFAACPACRWHSTETSGERGMLTGVMRRSGAQRMCSPRPCEQGVWRENCYGNYIICNAVPPVLPCWFAAAGIFCFAANAIPAATPGYLQNVSTRVGVGTGDNATISGFIIKGGAQTVVLRALGPTLARYGVAGALPDSMLELHNASGAVIASNDNWQRTQAAEFSRGGAYRSFQPGSTQDSAIATTLQPGAYSAVVRGKNGESGVALAEVYVASQSAGASVSNMSTRAVVGTGDNVLIGGLVIGGESSVPVLLRALGPSLTRFGVTGALSNPILELHNRDGTLIGLCDDWRSDADQAARVSGAGYAPASALEPALAVTLSPGNYTAVVRGAANATGVALFEVYQLPVTESVSSAPVSDPTPTPPATVAGLPRGVFSLVKAGSNPDASTLANGNVDGISLRQAWSELEPSDGVYNWAYLDAQLSRVQAAGKEISLRIGTGGDNIPAWILNAVRSTGGNTFTFSDSDGRHTIPVYWDPTFVAKKQAMIQAVGARYGSNPALKVFSTAIANASSDDWSVPHNNTVDAGYAISEVLRWQNAGYTSQKLIDAGRAVIDTTMRAFPRQLVALPINSNGNALDYPQDDNYVSDSIIANARNAWGTARLIVAKNSLSAKTPPATAASGSWSVLENNRPAVAGQALWFSFGDRTYRNNGGTPCSAATSLQRLVDTGVTYGMGYIELYEVDVINQPSVIAYAHGALN